MSMGDPSTSPKALTRPRTQQACQRCRSLKARCLPSEHQGTCQRCLASKRDCVWLESQPKARLPRGPSRIRQVERKIDGLVAHIANAQASEQSIVIDKADTPAGPGPTCRQVGSRNHTSPLDSVDWTNEPKQASIRQSNRTLQHLTDIHNFESDSDSDGADSVHDPTADDWSVGSDDALAKSLMARTEAVPLFEAYRDMASSFPFVPISVNTTAQDVCKRKPILFLICLAVASWDNATLRVSLREQYKRELAFRTMIRPQKTLALLQSILVYIAWYHSFGDTKLQHALILQMAVGLTIDLKLDPRTMPHMLPGRDQSRRVRGGKDGQRALLGCYYLCSVSSSAYQMPNLFRQSRHMFECCRQFEQANELDSDTTMLRLVRAQSVKDQIYEFFHSSGPGQKQLSEQQVVAQLQTWTAYLQDCKDQVRDLDDMQLLRHPYHSIEMDLYHYAFRSLHHDFSSEFTVPNTTLVQLLSSCLEAGRSFLDSLIAIPTENFHLVSYSVWSRLPRTMITLAMLSTSSVHHIPGWDVKAASDRIRLDLFIESLCFRMQTLTSCNPVIQKEPDFWLAMKMVLQSVGRWLKTVKNRSVAELTPASGATHDTSQSSGMDTNLADHEMYAAAMYSTQPSSTGSFTLKFDAINNNNNSINNTTYTQFDSSFPQEPLAASITCPMMNFDKSVDFDMDQFMDTGFWGTSLGGYEMMNFDFEV